MFYFKKIISYFDYYEFGEKKKNCGHVRVLVKDQEVTVEIHIKGLGTQESRMCDIQVTGQNQNRLGRFVLDKGTGYYNACFHRGNMDGSGLSAFDITGLHIQIDEERYCEANWNWGKVPETYKSPFKEKQSPENLRAKAEDEQKPLNRDRDNRDEIPRIGSMQKLQSVQKEIQPEFLYVPQATIHFPNAVNGTEQMETEKNVEVHRNHNVVQCTNGTQYGEGALYENEGESVETVQNEGKKDCTGGGNNKKEIEYVRVTNYERETKRAGETGTEEDTDTAYAGNIKHETAEDRKDCMVAVEKSLPADDIQQREKREYTESLRQTENGEYTEPSWQTGKVEYTKPLQQTEKAEYREPLQQTEKAEYREPLQQTEKTEYHEAVKQMEEPSYSESVQQPIHNEPVQQTEKEECSAKAGTEKKADRHTEEQSNAVFRGRQQRKKNVENEAVLHKSQMGTKEEEIKAWYQNETEEIPLQKMLYEDKWKQLCCQYPICHPFGENEDYISIAPKDFVILRKEYQNLVSNSFLLHSFYNYHHVILGKTEDRNEEMFYIGVPGAYLEREKKVAVMFGFEGFALSERGNRARSMAGNRNGNIETGAFGYYMRKVEI